MKKILPFRQPPIISYYTFMYPLAILAAYKEYLPWLYSTHIQMFNMPGEHLLFYTNPWCTTPRTRDAYISTCPLLDSTPICSSMWQSFLREDPIELIINYINQDFYVQVDEDDFYIPFRPHYQKSHFLHELLLIGYNLEDRRFLGMGFHNGKFDITEIEFQDLRCALSTTTSEFIKERQRLGPIPPRNLANMSERPQAILYRYREREPVHFDSVAVHEQLSDYINSRNTSERFRMANSPVYNAVWGMDTYTILRAHLQFLGDISDYNPIFIRIFCEHKYVMKHRLQYMESHNYLDKKHKFAIAYENIAKLAHNLHLIMVRWIRRPNGKTVRTALAKLDEIAEFEREVIGQVLMST